jgi:hypothetical protein
MKKILAALLALATSAVFAATTVPVQLLNPTGSAAGQAIVSAGASTAPAWGVVGVAGGGTGATTASAARTNLGAASTGANTFSGVQTISSSAPDLRLSASAAGTQARIDFQIGTNNRWGILKDSDPESGSNAGSSLIFNAYDDTGALLSKPLSIARATGVATFTQRPVFGSATPWDSANLPSVAGRFLNVQVFSSSGIYTPTTGTAKIVVKVQAPGGGSGGAATTAAGQSASGSGGGAGSYAEALVTSGFSGVTVTIGAVGTGAAAGVNNGAAGGTTSFGSIVSCPGGLGGNGGGASSGAGPTGASGFSSTCTISGATTIYAVQGSSGGPGMVMAPGTMSAGGTGGNSPLGMGGIARVSSAGGTAGVGYGAGAGGANNLASAGAAAGANGQPAIVIIYEFSN